MEEEKKEEAQIPRKKRRVSLFRRRKKPNIRPFVQQKKHRQYRKLVARILIIFGILAALATVLFFVQRVLIPRLFLSSTKILTPQPSIPLTNSEVIKLIQETASDVTDVKFSTGSAAISYTLHGNIQVYLSPEKDIRQQVSLVDSIDRQVASDGKQAISIDLRYNKPIVKY